MTRKDFELIANVISSDLTFMPDNSKSHVALRFADKLEKANPNFDRKKFLAASLKTEKKL